MTWTATKNAVMARANDEVVMLLSDGRYNAISCFNRRFDVGLFGNIYYRERTRKLVRMANRGVKKYEHGASAREKVTKYRGRVTRTEQDKLKLGSKSHHIRTSDRNKVRFSIHG
jgi:hypothetical protein